MIDQLRIDGGREFFLCIGMQEQHAHLRGNQTIQSYKQTQSKKVNKISFSMF